MNKESALAIFNSRKLIAEPGQFRLKVTSATPFQREDGTLVKITNYAAMTPYHLEQAKALSKEEKWQEATNQALSSSQRIGKDFTPVKGQFVDVLVDNIINKEGITILAVVAVTPIASSSATNVSFDTVEEEIATPEEELV